MKRFLPFVAIIIVWLIFFWPQIAGGQVWYCCDNLLINVPSKVYLANELKLGKFPTENPHIFSGTPFYADINLSLLHPFNLFYFVLPPFGALTAGIVLLFLIGTVGMYILGRMLRLRSFAALCGAVVFGFSGTLVVYANNVTILQVAVLVPWVLAAWIRYLEKMTVMRLILFVSIASLQVFSGHPQLTYYTWLMLIAYVFTQKPSVHMAKHGLQASLLVALVTSVQTVPFIRFMLESTRTGQDFVQASAGALQPLTFVRLILPGIVGDLSRGTAWIQAGSMHGYVGLLPILLIPFAWRVRTGKFFIGLSIVSLLMAMGKFTPVYWVAYHLVPGIALLREPGQFLFLWSFALSGVFMTAIDAVMKRPLRVSYLFIVGVGFLVATGILLTVQGQAWEWMTTYAYVPARLMEKISALSSSEQKIILDGLVYNGSLFGVLVLIGALALGNIRSSKAANAVLLGVICIDLFVYSRMNVTTISNTVVAGWQEATRLRLAAWKLPNPIPFRYYTDPVIYPYPAKVRFGQFNDPGESEWQFNILRPNLGMLYGLPAVDGYSSMVSRQYQVKFSSSVYAPTGVVIRSIVDPALPRVGVRYIITKKGNPLLSDAARYTVLAVESDVAIYEDNEAHPITSAKETGR